MSAGHGQWPPPKKSRAAPTQDRAAPSNDSPSSGIERDHSTDAEFGNNRRAFLVAMLMLGATTPARIVERVLADVECELAS